MLFFRSEEAIDEWCAAHRQPRGPLADLEQLWKLARAWYSNRLAADARRPQPDEIRDIFAAAGLSDPAWNPLADAF